jgi:hypothetical protein
MSLDGPRGRVTRPDLKQFGDLTERDFETSPVWIGCHTVDYDELYKTSRKGDVEVER